MASALNPSTIRRDKQPVAGPPLSKKVAAELFVGEPYGMRTDESARQLLPGAAVVVADKGAEVQPGDYVVAWRRGCPSIYKLALLPLSIDQADGTRLFMGPMACDLPGEDEPRLVDTRDIDHLHRIAATVDEHGQMFSVGPQAPALNA